MEWTAGAPWSIRDSYQGVQIFGSTGSGKSSGSLALLCRNMLNAGYAGIFFTVKPEDRWTYEGYVHDAGREQDLRIFSPDHALRYNFIAAERDQAKDSVGLAENLTALIMTVAELGDRQRGSRSGGSSNDEYFRQAKLRHCRHALFVLSLSGHAISMPTLHRLVISAPRSREEARSGEWQGSSYLFKCLQAAVTSPKTPSQRDDFDLAVSYFMEEWPTLNDRTRTSIESTLTSATDALSRGAVRDMMSSPTPTFAPSDLYGGAIVIADFPTLVYRDIGQLIQVVLKYSVQRALSRRDVNVHPRPVFLVCDESHHLTVESDQIFQTTARSACVATINATQSLSNLLEAFGPQSEPKVHSMLGNLQTLINHQQTDVQTIRHVQELIGRSRRYLMNGSTQRSNDWLGTLLGQGDGSTAGFSESLDFELEAGDLNGLAKGGPPHFYTEAIVYQGGRTFPNGRTWCRTRVPQQRHQTRQ